MATKPRDWVGLREAELRRLGTSLLTRRVEQAGVTHELTDRCLTFLLRRVDGPTLSGCWRWTGNCNRDGYGRYGKGAPFLAHRVVYQILRGPIPAGLTLDHLCRVPPCVNPDHLEPCSIGENSARSPLVRSSINRAKTACPQGHPYDGLVRQGDRYQTRYCKRCHADGERRRRERLRCSDGGLPNG